MSRRAVRLRGSDQAYGSGIATTGGTGDADLYARFCLAPNTTTYNCRRYLSGNAESCSFPTPQAGTYHVMVRGYSAFSGVTLTASYSTGGGGTQPSFFQNNNVFAIADNSTIESSIAVSGRSGNAPSTLQVALRIIHTYKGYLKVDLIAPNGTVYVLHNRTGGSADNIIQTFTVNASAPSGQRHLEAACQRQRGRGYRSTRELEPAVLRRILGRASPLAPGPRPSTGSIGRPAQQGRLALGMRLTHACRACKPSCQRSTGGRSA